MNDSRIPAPVSGEIIVSRDDGATARARDSAPAAEIHDAEYETLDDAAGTPRTAVGCSAAAEAVQAPSGLDMLRTGRRQRPSKSVLPHRSALWLAAVATVAASFWMSGGHAVLGNAPAQSQTTAAPLRIAKLESRVERSGSRAFLLIDGEAVNAGAQPERLPALAISVLDRGGRTTHYFLGTNGTELSAGARFAFSSRLAAPKDGVKSVSVTFGE